jgi:hypothetical protein
MNRITALVLSFIFLFATLPMTGCTVTDAQIRADAQAVAAAAGNIAVVLKATNPDLADKLSMAASALSAAAANYNTGSTTAIIETAAAAVEIALAAIPQTTAYAPLVAIAVAAIEVLLANLPQKDAVKAMAVPHEPNPYRGQATIKHRFGRSPEGDLKAAWNEKVVGTGVAPIR